MITVQWDNLQRTIIRLDYTNPIESWQEYRQAVNTSYAMANEVKHPCSIIHDATDTTMPNTGANRTLIEIVQTIKTAPTNVHTIISVITTPIEKRIVNITEQITIPHNQTQVYTVATLDDAYAILDQQQNANSSS